MNPPHRPPLPPGERRDVTVQIRAKASTVAEWDAAAASSEMTRSEWIRRVLAEAMQKGGAMTRREELLFELEHEDDPRRAASLRARLATMNAQEAEIAKIEARLLKDVGAPAVDAFRRGMVAGRLPHDVFEIIHQTVWGVPTPTVPDLLAQLWPSR